MLFGQWEFQDPKMEGLYYIREYFVGIFPYIGLIYGRYLQFRILKFPLIWAAEFCNGIPCIAGPTGHQQEQKWVQLWPFTSYKYL